MKLPFQTKASGRILNYVWINKEPFEPGTQGSCGIPLHYLDRSITNAKRYPDVQVDIWLDSRLLDQNSMDTAADHIARHKTSNVRLRDLNEIPAFREVSHTIFDHTRDVAELRGIPAEQRTFEHHNIWSRVDLARLLVIQNALEKSVARDVVYSDFDAADVRLNDPAANAHLEKYGMVFGLAPSSTTGKHEIIENGYMAFRRDGMDKALFHRILAQTKEEAAAGYNGYGPFYQELKSWCEDRNIPDFPAAISIELLPAMRYEIPRLRSQSLDS